MKRRRWSDAELEELGPTLRSLIVSREAENGGPLLEDRRCLPPCGRRFRPAKPSHVFCSGRCRQRAYRWRVAQQHAPEHDRLAARDASPGWVVVQVDLSKTTDSGRNATAEENVTTAPAMKSCQTLPPATTA